LLKRAADAGTFRNPQNVEQLDKDDDIDPAPRA